MDFSTSGQGATYYVSPSGDDTNPGTQVHPWKTIQKAANVVGAGSMVIVQAGNFPERVMVDHSGSTDLPITFEAQGTVVMRGFTITADYVTIRGFEITETLNTFPDNWGILVNGGNCLIEGNYIHDASSGGIILFVRPGQEPKTHDCTVRNNRLFHNVLVGAEVHGRNNILEGNEIWGTIQYRGAAPLLSSVADADGIRFFGSGHLIRRNHIHDIRYGIPENINPHIDCFQTWGDGKDYETASNIVIEQNFCSNMQAQALHEVGQGFMIKSANQLLICNNIIRAYRVVNAVNSNGLKILNNTFTNDLNLTNADSPIYHYPLKQPQ